MGYQPIRPIGGPGLIDIPIWADSQSFSGAPALGFLKGRLEMVSASSTYYDPLQPSASTAAPVIYNETLLITTLSEAPLKLRHNGSTIDMEIYVDTYTKIQKEREMGEFSVEKRITSMKEGDRFERYTTGYVYANLEVPPRSNVVWDGRGGKCVDASGEEVDASNRLPIIRGEVRAILEDPSLTPYTVFSLGGYGHTVREPSSGLNRDKYDVGMQNFLEEHYTSEGIGGVNELGRIERTDETGRGTEIEETRRRSERVAVLDGHYFVRWATLVVTEIEYSNDN